MMQIAILFNLFHSLMIREVTLSGGYEHGRLYRAVKPDSRQI
jgi:hypothetical protein